jgi:hypothetical protein
MTSRAGASSHSATVAQHPLEAELGAPEYYRIWCSAEASPLNDYHSIEFCGWPVGWSEAALDPPVEAARAGRSGPAATRVEVEIFLTTDGKLVSVVELVGDEPGQYASSPPDLWATFLGQHDNLAAAGTWLTSVEHSCGREGCRAVTDALDQAMETLASLPNGWRAGA